jgi:hypothetical protein
MKKYNLIDLQQKGMKEIQTADEIRGYAFLIMKDRSESVNDSLGQEFSEVVSKGFENYTFDQAVELLKDWEYKVEEIK